MGPGTTRIRRRLAATTRRRLCRADKDRLADQEQDWGPFESAVKDSAKARVVALQKEQGNNLSPMDRLNAKGERLTQGTANLETIVEAAKPLYASLDETQKHTFITLGRMLVPERGRFAKEMRRLRVGEADQHSAE